MYSLMHTWVLRRNAWMYIILSKKFTYTTLRQHMITIQCYYFYLFLFIVLCMLCVWWKVIISWMFFRCYFCWLVLLFAYRFRYGLFLFIPPVFNFGNFFPSKICYKIEFSYDNNQLHHNILISIHRLVTTNFLFNIFDKMWRLLLYNNWHLKTFFKREKTPKTVNCWEKLMP